MVKSVNVYGLSLLNKDTGYQILDTAYQILDTGYQILDTGYWILLLHTGFIGLLTFQRCNNNKFGIHNTTIHSQIQFHPKNIKTRKLRLDNISTNYLKNKMQTFPLSFANYLCKSYYVTGFADFFSINLRILKFLQL